MTLRSLKGTLKSTLPELTRSLRSSIWDNSEPTTSAKDNPIELKLFHDLANLKISELVKSFIKNADANTFIAFDTADAITNVGAVYTVEREFFAVCSGNLFRVNAGVDTEATKIRLEISATEYSMFQTLDIADGTSVTAFEGNDVGDGVVNIDEIVWISDSLIELVDVPSSASDSGVSGQMSFDSNFIYLCTATDTWKRVAISTW